MFHTLITSGLFWQFPALGSCAPFSRQALLPRAADALQRFLRFIFEGERDVALVSTRH